jgi:hypothetical protein
MPKLSSQGEVQRGRDEFNVVVLLVEKTPDEQWEVAGAVSSDVLLDRMELLLSVSLWLCPQDFQHPWSKPEISLFL